jgi:hypothetical protein
MNTEVNPAPREATAATVQAIILWVLVSAALLYGVVKTAIAAAALFGA